MATRNVAYVGTFLPESLRKVDDWSSQSPAGQAKQKSTITALSQSDCRVDAVSSVVPIRDGIGRVSRQVTESEHAQVHVPPNVDVVPDSGPPLLLHLLRIVQFKLILPLVVTLYLCLLSRRREYDAIVFYNFNIVTAFPAQIAGILFRVPILIDFNDSRLDSRDWLDRLRDEVYLYLVDPWLSGAICINTNMTSLLRTDNTAVVRGEPSVRKPTDSEIESDPGGSLTLFYGGKLDDVRGIDILLDSAAEIVSGRDVEIRITGYGSRFEEVQQRVSELDVDQVSFLGFVSSDEYRRELVEADIAVNLQSPDAPGNKYTFPTKILDYLVTGNVVVSTRMSDLETVLDDVLVFTDPSPNDFVSTVDGVCEDFPDHRERITAGRAWIREHCSQERRIEKISGLLDEACVP